jgi:hypothetical protein
VHDHGQTAEDFLDRAGGELQAAVDAYELGHRAERREVRLVGERHAHRGEHRTGGRGGGDGPAEQGPGAVVHHGGQPRRERLALRRQDQDRELLVVRPRSASGRRK